MLTIKVMQKDIDAGIRYHTGQCPIAKAIRRKTKKVVTVSNLIRINRIPYAGVNSEDKEKIQNFVSDFDIGGPKKVKPMTIKIERLG